MREMGGREKILNCKFQNANLGEKRYYHEDTKTRGREAVEIEREEESGRAGDC